MGNKCCFASPPPATPPPGPPPPMGEWVLVPVDHAPTPKAPLPTMPAIPPPMKEEEKDENSVACPSPALSMKAEEEPVTVTAWTPTDTPIALPIALPTTTPSSPQKRRAFASKRHGSSASTCGSSSSSLTPGCHMANRAACRRGACGAQVEKEKRASVAAAAAEQRRASLKSMLSRRGSMDAAVAAHAAVAGQRRASLT
uniref:Uncharacterized protein n=1 Tax=Chromera velia CCMP2878 TaxID=1169474 RepID=A0A0G4HGY5_9ALVE|eukprot:Cvel_27485.t1-p1 / transcript=Cvel_27485.t1 / gene=Cvel_27485 / organism=Chromera_velia_CCMP2878 / gene_product=hypothetical protein / transcript_product=hypothetical protein / location=Cvel_scaffold3437:651-2179(-) / protein_length=198 / sequence_SO=supercontig / SO=protein_coding / is_pseudo=false